MLSLATDLKTAIRESGLKGVHAMALQKLSAKNLKLSEEEARTIREETTRQVISGQLSASQTRQLVAEVIQSRSQSSPTAPQQPQQKKLVSTTTKQLQLLPKELLAQASKKQLLDFQKALRHKLAEIEDLLNS